MNTNHFPLRLRSVLAQSLRGALQWRLWLLCIAATLMCALVGALPAWNWLASVFDHSLQAGAIAAGQAPSLIMESLTASAAPLGLLAQSSLVASVIMVLLAPLLGGAMVAAARAQVPLGFGELLRGGIGEYGPMLRMLLWSAVPLGFALLVMFAIIGGNEKAHADAILASELEGGRRIALIVGGVLFVLAHASLEGGRGWLAADGRLRSAIKDWWRGLGLLRRRPVAVLSVYLLTTATSLLLALLLLALRQRVDGAGLSGSVLALLLACGIAGVLAGGRIARLFGMKALAEDMHARR